jgi:hypothetical protein
LVLLPIGTFQMTTDGIDAPLVALDAARRERNVPPSQFGTLGFGESVRLGYHSASPTSDSQARCTRA